MFKNCYHSIKIQHPCNSFFHKKKKRKKFTNCHHSSTIILPSPIPFPMVSHSFFSALPLEHQFPVNIILSIHSNYRERERERKGKMAKAQNLNQQKLQFNILMWLTGEAWSSFLLPELEDKD